MSSTVVPQGRWVFQTSGTDEILDGMFVLNATTVFVVGWNGTLLRTVNGGGKWTRLAPDTFGSDGLKGVYFQDASRGWVVGSEGKIYGTTDGGERWHRVFDSGSYGGLYDIAFIDDQTGFAVGGDSFRTDDGGETWERIATGMEGVLYKIATYGQNLWVGGTSGVARHLEGVGFLPQGGGSACNETCGLSFPTSELGWYLGEGKLMKTLDGGATWKAQPIRIENGGDPLSAYAHHDVLFTDADHGWIAQERRILSTTDGGANWRETPLPGIESLRAIRMVDQTGWVTSTRGGIARYVIL